MQKLKEMWDGRGMKARGEPSLSSQLKTIEVGGLTKMVREEIEKRVRKEVEEEEEMKRVRERFLESSDEEDFYGFEDDGMGEMVQGNEEVDFVVEGNGLGAKSEEDGRGVDLGEEGREMVDDGKRGGMIGDDRQVEVRVERVDVWQSGREVRVMTEVERGVLQRMREVFGSKDVVDLPNLKAQDRRKVMAEVKMVDGLLHNLVRDGMNVTGEPACLCRSVCGGGATGSVGQGEEEEGEREAMVATEIGEEYWRVEEGFEQSGRDKERDGSWTEGE